jgi:hypothetical protein
MRIERVPPPNKQLARSSGSAVDAFTQCDIQVVCLSFDVADGMREAAHRIARRAGLQTIETAGRVYITGDAWHADLQRLTSQNSAATETPSV